MRGYCSICKRLRFIDSVSESCKQCMSSIRSKCLNISGSDIKQ